MTLADREGLLRCWRLKRYVVAAALGMMIVVAGGCEDDDDGPSHDFGDNNPDLYVAMGDSITRGHNVKPYPATLSELLGATVVNEGISGEHAYEAAVRVDALLERYQPGYLLILYGANDILHYVDLDNIEANLLYIVQAAKNAKTIPVIATLTPMVRSHSLFQGRVEHLNDRIRDLAGAESIRVVRLDAVFGDRDDDANPYVLDDDDYLQWDGLHPNEEGTRQMARAFASSL